jgi:hypothetical protein
MKTKSYIVTEKQFNRIVESENSFEDGSMVKLIQRYLDDVVVPQTNLICKSVVYRLEKRGDYVIRIWVNQNEPHTQDDSDDLVDSTWESIHNMFGITTAIHRVKSSC